MDTHLPGHCGRLQACPDIAAPAARQNRSLQLASLSNIRGEIDAAKSLVLITYRLAPKNADRRSEQRHE